MHGVVNKISDNIIQLYLIPSGNGNKMFEKTCLFNLWDFEVDGGWAEGGLCRRNGKRSFYTAVLLQPEWTSDYLG